MVIVVMIVIMMIVMFSFIVYRLSMYVCVCVWAKAGVAISYDIHNCRRNISNHKHFSKYSTHQVIPCNAPSELCICVYTCVCVCVCVCQSIVVVKWLCVSNIHDLTGQAEARELLIIRGPLTDILHSVWHCGKSVVKEGKGKKKKKKKTRQYICCKIYCHTLIALCSDLLHLLHLLYIDFT